MDAGNILNNLARNRTILANERTFLAYARTAIMLAVSGVTLVKFFSGELYLLIIGIALIPLAIGLTVFGFIRYKAMCRRITRTIVQEADVNSQYGAFQSNTQKSK